MASAVTFDPNAPSEVVSTPEFDPNAPSEVVADESANPETKPRSFLDRASFAIHHPVESAKEELGLVKDAVSSVPDKVADSFTNFGKTVGKAITGAGDLVSPVTSKGEIHVPFSQLTSPEYRRELERGVSDTVTGGLATKVAEGADELAHKKFGLERRMTPEQKEADAKAAPEARALGQVGGTALPSPFNYIGGQAAKLVPGAPAAVKGLIGYEASAVPQAAIAGAANAPEGHRLEEAGKAALGAATDPAGVATSAAVPTITSYLQKKLATAAERAPEVEAKAKVRAVKDLGKDITSAEGPKARVTDQKRVAEVNDRLYDLADKNPELRQAFSEPAEKALPKIQAFKQKIAEPLDRLYDTIDEKTGGGIDAKSVVKDLRDMANEKSNRVHGLGDAKRLNDLADQFEQVYVKNASPENPVTQQHGVGEPPHYSEEWWKAAQREWEGKKGHSTVGDVTNPGGKGGAEPEFSPEQIHKQIELLQKVRENASPVAAKGIDEQVAKLRDEVDAFAKTAVDKSPMGATGGKIPTRVFREEVTELLKKSDSVIGGIEGTPRFEALQRLYDAGKRIIDKHIDTSGLPAEQIAQIRDINNGYFLLSRAEQAIESRGWKEANKSGTKFPMSVKQAIHGGGLGGIAMAAALGGPHAVVHALPYIAGAELTTHALPKAMKAINWDMAHGGYTRAIAHLAKVAKATATVGQFVSQATRAGLAADQARKIWEAAHKVPVTPETSGDITL